METYDVINPAAPAEITGTYTLTSAKTIDDIVSRSNDAQRSWQKKTQIDRAEAIAVFLDGLEARKSDLAQSIVLEMGKTLKEAYGEIAKSIAEGRATLKRATAPVGEIFPSKFAEHTSLTMRRPRGTILGINPWNFPFGTPIRKTIPALLYGNSIILKPASQTPGAAVIMQEVAQRTLPTELLQVVIGGGQFADKICRHEGVHGVTFTGSVDTGKRVAQAAVSHLAEVSLELGGKNPVIVNDTLDHEKMLDQIYTAAFAICGQRCTALSRVIVHESLADRVIEGLAARAKSAVLGMGLYESTTMGPLASEAQLETVDSFVQKAVTQGARIVEGGHRSPSDEGGYFYRPTILDDVSPDHDVATQEVFGPVLAVLKYSDFDEALSIANSTQYGLSSCLYSDRHSIVKQFIETSESGMLHVNNGSFPQDHTPFVGVKDSALGVGGSNGPSTIQFYTTEHMVYL